MVGRGQQLTVAGGIAVRPQLDVDTREATLRQPLLEPPHLFRARQLAPSNSPVHTSAATTEPRRDDVVAPSASATTRTYGSYDADTMTT